jgi:hypothetical protein
MNSRRAICLCALVTACRASEPPGTDAAFVVRERLPVDTTAAPPPFYRLHSSGSNEAVVISGRNRGHVSLISAGRHGSAIRTPDSLLIVSNAGFLGDSIWIADDASRRLLFFNRTTRRWSEMLTPSLQVKAQTAVIGILADGAVIVASRASEASRDTVTTWLLAESVDSTFVIDSLMAHGGPLKVSAAEGEPSAMLEQPWLFADFAVVSRNGGALTILRQSPPHRGDTSVNVLVARYRNTHSAPSVQTLRFRTAKVDEAAVMAWLSFVMRDSLVNMLGGRSRAESQLRAALFRPLYMPAIRRVIAGWHESILLERAAIDSMHHWEIWDANGKFTGSFVLRPEIVLQDAPDSTIWAVTHGKNGSNTVVTGTLHLRGAVLP